MRFASLYARLANAVRIRRRIVHWGRRDAGPIEPVAPAEGLSIRRVREDDIDLLCRVGPVDRADIGDRLARGDWGYLAMIGDLPAGYCWVQFSGVHTVSQVGRSYTIAPGENMVYNSRTAESARGKRVYSSIMARILEDLFAAGHVAAWGYVNSDNEAPIRGMTRLGFVFYKDWKALHVSYWVIPLDSP